MIRRGRFAGPALGTQNYYKYIYGESGDYGTDQDRSTGSNYARQTGWMWLHRFMIVTAILWDIRIADTYICRFVTTINGTTSEFDVNTAHVAAGGGESTITPTNGDFLLTPGYYYLQLATHDAATVGWYDYNASRYQSTVVSLGGLYYTTTSFGEYTIPIKLRGYTIEFPNLTRYQKL